MPAYSLIKRIPILLLAALPLVAHAQKVVPTAVGTGTGTRWTFTMGPMTFQSGAKNGGRIHSLKFAASEVLHMDTATATNYGSTFWPSPQAVWNWPPPANLDGTGAYSAAVGTDTILNMAGSADNTTKIRIRKEYWADLGDSSFNMRYTLVNTGTARAWAPWEDTRVDTGGIYLFPKGEGAITGDLATFTKDSLNMIWYTHNAASTLTTGTTKFYADGSQGWFAHIAPNRVLLIKKFTDSPLAKKAPSPENEIELYTTNKPLNNSDFVEMENQGAYDTILTNDSLSWRMKWYIRKIPDTMTVAVGNQAIVNYINQVLASGPTSLREEGGTGGKASFARLRHAGNRVSLFLEKGANVSLSVMNARGQEISRVHAGRLPQGGHDFALAANLPKGIYWLVLKSAAGPEILAMQKLIRL